MTYDLRRLSRKGLIRRQPRSNTYALTAHGIRVAIFYTKVYGSLIRHSLPSITHLPQWSSAKPSASSTPTSPPRLIAHAFPEQHDKLD